ncbi:hypothetical protein [Paucilactobacillus sp. N302-9]
MVPFIVIVFILLLAGFGQLFSNSLKKQQANGKHFSEQRYDDRKA